MKHTLLTGFGPFGEVVNNPAERIARHFELSGAPGHIITVYVFPVSYEAVKSELATLLGAEGAVDFDNVVMLGVNSRATEWRIERIGANADGKGKVDATGVTPQNSEIIPGAPAQLFSNLPVDLIVESLTAVGIPIGPSDSAGAYLCNHLLYRALHRLHGNSGVTAGFIHIPPDPETFASGDANKPEFAPSFEEQIRVIELILEVLQ